jgi:2-polyprenyl-3-methyl-5-hydroxy-6-metoxy-1,4-benzoquinol methylase
VSNVSGPDGTAAGRAAEAARASAWQIPAAYTGERLAAEDVRFAPDMARHLAAYHLVAPFIGGKRVLEAGCGEGYGAALMARHAAQVVGVDYNVPALELARARHRLPNLEYRTANLLDLAKEQPGEFDVVTNFQVLEHLADPRPFLGAAAACVKPGGLLILTTPNRLASVSENPYHMHEYVAPELQALLARFFAHVDVHGIVGTERVYAFERARGEQARRILRLDPLGLRNLLPQKLVRWAFARLALLVRSRVAAQGKDLVELTPQDFSIAEREPPQWIDLVALARR